MSKIIGFVMLWVLMTIMGGVCELSYLGTGDVGKLQILTTGINWGQASGIWGGVNVFMDFVSNWIATLVDMLFFNYSFFQGEMMIVKYILFLPIGIGIIYGIVAMVRGTNA